MIKDFRRTLIIGISYIAGSFVVFAIVIYFLSSAVSAQVKKISDDKNSIRNRSDLIEGLARQKASSPEVQKFQQAINLLLPKKDELVNLSSWIDGLSRARNVGASFSFSGEATQPTDSSAGHIKFTMNANGQYSNLADFLKDVELRSPRYTISFDDFDLKRNINSYSITINGRVFFR